MSGPDAGLRHLSRCDCYSSFSEALSPEKIAQTLRETPIDPALAAEESVYRGRIRRCGECEALREKVLCSHCGCFVLFRARPANSRCPHPLGDRWA